MKKRNSNLILFFSLFFGLIGISMVNTSPIPPDESSTEIIGRCSCGKNSISCPVGCGCGCVCESGTSNCVFLCDCPSGSTIVRTLGNLNVEKEVDVLLDNIAVSYLAEVLQVKFKDRNVLVPANMMNKTLSLDLFNTTFEEACAEIGFRLEEKRFPVKQP